MAKKKATRPAPKSAVKAATAKKATVKKAKFPAPKGAAKPAVKTTKRKPAKPTVKKRTVNYPGAPAPGGAPTTDQDPQRRLGNFEGAGEPARKGGRTSGIVGQTTKTFRTDNKKK